MKVPLLVDLGINTITIVRNSVVEEIPLPTKPRIYVITGDEAVLGNYTERGRKQISRIPIGSRKEEAIDIIELDTIPELDKAYYKNLPMCRYEYDELLYCEYPDFFCSYPNTDPLRIMVLDIEVLTRGMGLFPNADRDPIIAIGCGMTTEDGNYIITIDSPNDERCEKEGIDRFIKYIIAKDPDVIATYNGERFDIAYLLKRMEHLSIDPSYMCRTGLENKKVTPKDIPGRIHWDIWKDVDGDQTLLGLPNKRLKTICSHYGWSVIDLGREALSNTSKLVGKPELSGYLESDVILTRKLTDVYLLNHVVMAERMSMPLREKMNAYDSLIPKIMHVRGLGNKYIGVRTNEERYKDTFGTMRYASAKVALYDNGVPVKELRRYFKKVFKIDFSSQYPTAIDTFNLSPETCSLVDVKEYTGNFKFGNTGKFLWFNIPDKNAKVDMVIRVNISVDSFLRREIESLKEQKSLLKAEMKQRPDDKVLNSKYWAVKVLMNSIYGYEGQASARWSELPVAIATVGLCRWIVEQVEGMLGKTLIETDSVTGCTPLCILRDDKYIDFLPISELVPDYAYESINIRYSHVPKNIKILTRAGWKGINYVKQHLVNKDIYRINTTDGYVEVTGDHSLFSKDGSGITPLDMEPGSEIELRELPKHSYEVDYSEEFAWLLGFIAAEGTVDINPTRTDKRSRYQLSIVNQDTTLLDRCVNIIRGHYLVECQIYNTMRSSSVYKICKNDKTMVTELYNLCYTPHGSKKVPLFILNGTDNIKRAYLNGIWVGDGFTRSNGVESLSSIDHTLFAGVKYLMNCLGKETSVLLYNEKMNVLVVNTRNGRRNGANVNLNRVKRVEKLLASTPTWVYDVSTEDGSFVTGIGGLCCFNTDGIYVDTDPDIDTLNKRMSGIIEKTFGIESRMDIELEEFDDGYFYRTKNYILRHNGKLHVKGNAFKSSKHSRVYEKATQIACEFILDTGATIGDRDLWFKRNDLVRKLTDWDSYELTDFIKHVTLDKDPDMYVNQNVMQVKLAEQAKKYLSQELHSGDGVDYIVTTRGRDNKEYTIAPRVTDRRQVYLDYYEGELETLLTALGFSETTRTGQLELPI